MPEGTVYVGRPSRWGNPYARPSKDEEVTLGAVFAFRSDLVNWNHDTRTRWLAPLRGKDLACWCPLDQPCHADVLLELANPS